MRPFSLILSVLAAGVTVSGVAGLAIDSRIADENLGDRCGEEGISCILAGLTIFVTGQGIDRSGPASNNSRWYVLERSGATGEARGCSGSTVTWTSYPGLNTFKGTDNETTRNDRRVRELGLRRMLHMRLTLQSVPRIRAFYLTDSSKMVIKGTLSSEVPGADLVLGCYPPPVRKAATATIRPRLEELDGPQAPLSISGSLGPSSSNSTEHRHTLGEACALDGVMCLITGQSISLVNASDGRLASERIDGGATVYQIKDDGAYGTIQGCDGSRARWSFAAGEGEKVFDGRDHVDHPNRKLAAFFIQDPSKVTVHERVTSYERGADLTIFCGP